MHRLLVILVLLLGMPLRLVAEPVPEYAMKAAFLYNFALFAEWPTHLDVINLCVSPENNLSSAIINGIDGREIRDGVHLKVMSLTAGTDFSSCQILVIGEPNRMHVHDFLNRVSGTPTLTITDVDGLLEQGVMISMYKNDKRLAFEVNLNASRRAGLKLSSKLLRLAQRVYE